MWGVGSREGGREDRDVGGRQYAKLYMYGEGKAEKENISKNVV